MRERLADEFGTELAEDVYAGFDQDSCLAATDIGTDPDTSSAKWPGAPQQGWPGMLRTAGRQPVSRTLQVLTDLVRLSLVAGACLALAVGRVEPWSGSSSSSPSPCCPAGCVSRAPSTWR